MIPAGATIGSNAVSAVAVGTNVNIGANASNSVAIGTNSTVNANVTGAVALGANAVATQSNTVSVGASGSEKRIVNVAAGTASTDAVNKGQMDTAVSTTLTTAQGYATTAETNAKSYADSRLATTQTLGGGTAGGAGAIAIGSGANAQSAGGIAMGQGAVAVQSNSVAIGAGARSQSSVAVGVNALAGGTNTTALGDNATATGNYAVAVGNQAQATHANSVALGNGSTTSAANTVSVGSAGNERRVTNVADGVADSDAATVRQLNAALGAFSGFGGGVATQADIGRLDQRIDELEGRLDSVARMAYQGTAMAAALSQPVITGVTGSSITVGVGSYKGEHAVGVSLHRTALQSNGLLSVGVASAGRSNTAVRAGFSIGF